MQNINFIEVGHFYADEHNNQLNLSYLGDVVSKLKGLKNTFCALFIDNYNSTVFNLDINHLKSHYEIALDMPVHIFYEGDMKEYYLRTLSLFNEKDLVITKYNRGKKEKLELALGDCRITIAEISPNFKITCAMLSLMWTLFRLGFYEDKKNNVITVIDEKFFNVEKKVLTMLQYIQDNHNHDCVSAVDYWFYKT